MATQESKLKEVTPAPAPAEVAKPKGNLRIIVAVVLAVLLAGLGFYYYTGLGYQSTDDAQVDADVVPVPARVGGVVVEVLFKENDPVKANEVLARIDPIEYKARVAQAEADLASAKANAEAASAGVTEVKASGSKEITSARAALSGASSARDTTATELTRAKNLYAEHAITKAQLDNAQNAFDNADAAFNTAKARLEAAVSGSEGGGGSQGTVQAQNAQARARAAAAEARIASAAKALEVANLQLSYTEIKAPKDGFASKKSIVLGQMIGAGQPVTMLVPQDELWVTANFKETQLAKMKVGQPVEVSIDAYPGMHLRGKVESFSGATGARFSLLPPENATGNFTKVVQRVPVRIAIEDLPKDRLLRAGLSADVTVDVR